MSTTTAPDTAVDDATARIGELRTEIDGCDAAIIELVQRRLAISREIGRLRAVQAGEHAVEVATCRARRGALEGGGTGEG